MYDMETLSHDKDPKIEGEPRLYYYEFEIFLARVALEIAFGLGGLDRTPIEQHIETFFKEKLCIRTNSELAEGKPVPTLKRKLFEYMGQIQEEEKKERNRMAQSQSLKKQQEKAKLLSKEQQGLEFSSDEEEFETVQDIIKEHAGKNRLELKPTAELDFQAVAIMLENELPELPEPFATQQENPPPFKTEKIVIGEALPKPPPDKNKAKPKQVKKQQRKKGEPEPRKVIWGDNPNILGEDNELQRLQKQQDSLQFRQPLISDFEKASLSHIEVAPCIIREVIYPLEVPPPVRTYVEAAILAHNSQNYAFAL